MDSPYKTISVAADNRVLTVTLDRPSKLNAFTTEMCFELIDVIERADVDESIGAIIFTGAGSAFCAGAELSGEGKTFDYENREDKINGIAPDRGGLLTLKLFDCKKPLICAINGAAVGIGATMQLPMDVRIASTKARFGFVFTNRGVVPEACSSWFLPRIVGISKALEWCLSGKIFDHQEALTGGLVSEITPPESLVSRAKEIANELIQQSAPVSLALTRQMLWKMLGADHPIEAHKIDSRGIQDRGISKDGIEGINSFLEKRDPKFRETPTRDMPAFYPWWKERKFE